MRQESPTASAPAVSLAAATEEHNSKPHVSAPSLYLPSTSRMYQGQAGRLLTSVAVSPDALAKNSFYCSGKRLQQSSEKTHVWTSACSRRHSETPKSGASSSWSSPKLSERAVATLFQQLPTLLPTSKVSIYTLQPSTAFFLFVSSSATVVTHSAPPTLPVSSK